MALDDGALAYVGPVEREHELVGSICQDFDELAGEMGRRMNLIDSAR